MRRPLLILCAATAVLAVTGCSQSDSSGGESGNAAWVSDIKQVSETTTNDFVRKATADGEITQAEVDEAHQRLIDCTADKGYDLEVHTVGRSYSYKIPQKGTNDGGVLTQCQEKSGSYPLAYFYTQVWSNPGNEDLTALRAACLSEHGLVGADFSGGQVKELILKYAKTGSTGLADEQQARACLENPAGVDALPGAEER